MTWAHDVYRGFERKLINTDVERKTEARGDSLTREENVNEWQKLEEREEEKILLTT